MTDETQADESAAITESGPVDETAADTAASDLFYCPACGRRYPEDGTCDNGHPPTALHELATDAPTVPEAAVEAPGAVAPVVDVTKTPAEGVAAAAAVAAPVSDELGLAHEALIEAEGAVGAAIDALQKLIGK